MMLSGSNAWQLVALSFVQAGRSILGRHEEKTKESV
jgi:hypothetical protein